uniref:DDE Tnp4 domain-containing protein n=1 Tax=Myripristis murdjan TaxID=586833 RepID=A0A667WS05_9TELE
TPLWRSVCLCIFILFYFIFKIRTFILQAQQYITLLLLRYRRREQDDMFITRGTLNLVPPPPPRARSQWMKVRSKDWWERVVLVEFTDQEWKQNFRMTRLSFMKLCTLMERHMAPEEVTVRPPVPLIMRVAIVLYKLGSCAEYRVIANQFGISKSSVKKFVYMFRKSMMRGPIKQLIRVPTDEEALEIARAFEASHHIPQIMGLIDGSHIPVLPPSDGYKDFVNRKGWPSYVLQAVVDHGRFLDVRTLGAEPTAFPNNNMSLYLFSQCVKNIEGKDINLFIVGDPAYPLLDWLIKGYPNSPRLTPQQESFNVYLSSVRVGVEMAFGLLKSRWRVLLKRSDFHFSFAPTMIATCCVLHNFCQKERDYANSSWLEEGRDRANNYPQPNQPVNLHKPATGLTEHPKNCQNTRVF